jgi:2-hydroxychromene-2-carboxylate isomerase
MTLAYDLFWSFRSPYSYLITHRLVALERDFDVKGNVRPVYPLAVRTPEFFDGRDPLWYSYLQLDIRREAEFLGLPIRWPRPDPVFMDTATRTYPKEQPHIHRLTRLGAAAQADGRSLPFVGAISRVLWDGTVKGWNEGDHLARAAAAAGLDLPTMDAAVAADPDRYEAIIAGNEKDHAASGHWGVPTFVFENEPFFGQDRIDLLIWRMQDKGLTRRS